MSKTEAERMERLIDDAVTYASLSRPSRDSYLGKHFFDDAEHVRGLLSEDVPIEKWSVQYVNNEFSKRSVEEKNKDKAVDLLLLSWNPTIFGNELIDISTFNYFNNYTEAKGKDPLRFVAIRFRETSAHLLRGKHAANGRNAKVFDRTFGVHWAWISQSGKFESRPWDWMGWSGTQWVGSAGYEHSDALVWRDLWHSASIACAALWTRRFNWRVSIGFEDAPAVSFMTDPVGAREVFRLRDIPNGKSRRTALTHWVREHWRQKRDVPEESVKVREHLRGASEFVWNGLRCRIVPSAIDQERAAGIAGAAQ